MTMQQAFYSLAQPATTILFKNTEITSCMQFYIILLTISFKFLLKAELLASTILKVRYNSPLKGRSMVYITILLLIVITIVNYVVARMYCFSGFCLLVSSIFMISRVESWGRITHSPLATSKLLYCHQQ